MQSPTVEQLLVVGHLEKMRGVRIKSSGSAVSSATDYSLRPDAGNRPPKLANESKFVVALREYSEAVAEHLLDRPISIEIWNDRQGHARLLPRREHRHQHRRRCPAIRQPSSSGLIIC